MQKFTYGFGIEEEFFLACRKTGLLVERMSPGLMQAAKGALGNSVSSELLQSQIEIASPILHATAEALETLATMRRTLSQIAGSTGASLIAAGTHPLGVWQEQLITQRPRYDELAAEFRIVSQRNLVCGLHVHVAIPPLIDRIDVMNRAMHWLPLFLSLSTSSPFWNGRMTGLLSYRQALYDEWPRSGIPDFLKDESEYRSFVELMRGADAIRHAGQLWWAIRPSDRFPTLELRIADACTSVEHSVAIASLFRCLVNALVDQPRLGRERSSMTRRIIDENRWRAKRDGVHARFIDERSRATTPVPVFLRELLQELDVYLDRHSCRKVVGVLHSLLEEGTSAHHQLRVYNDARARGDETSVAMGAVVQWLARTTVSEPLPADQEIASPMHSVQAGLHSPSLRTAS